jgi:hypothetical protein
VTLYAKPKAQFAICLSASLPTIEANPHRTQLSDVMSTYEYLQVTVLHNAREINIVRGVVPEDVEGGYFQLPRIFNELGSEGWLLRSSVHEQIAEVGAFTLHCFARETP